MVSKKRYIMTEEHKKKIGDAQRGSKNHAYGKDPWNKGKKGVMPIPWNKGKKTGIKPWLGKERDQNTKKKMKEFGFQKGSIPWNKNKKFIEVSGCNNPNWKGGITPINEKIRKSIEYKLWRKAVFERDNFTCKFCGQVGGKIQADHIKPFALFPELRFAIDNGRTLCENCHRKTETWGRVRSP